MAAILANLNMLHVL